MAPRRPIARWNGASLPSEWRILEFQIKKAPERYAVADQVLSLLVREIVQRLQHHDLELQDRGIGLATGVAPALRG
jgi:hypothetical protein